MGMSHDLEVAVEEGATLVRVGTAIFGERGKQATGGRMFVLGNILIGLGKVLDFVLQLYMWILIGRAIISWVNADPRNGDRALPASVPPTRRCA